MIKSNSYFTALGAAEELAARGIYLKAVAMTPLDELMEVSVSPETVKTTDLATKVVGGSSFNNLNISAEQRSQILEWATMDSNDTSLHTKKMMALAEDLTPIITSHLSYARNTVTPLVKDLSEKLVKYIQVTAVRSPESDFEIVQMDIPAIVLDESFYANGLENYVDYKAPNAHINFELNFAHDAPDEFYRGLVRLPNDRLNALVDAWLLEAGGVDFIRKVCLSNFTSSNYVSDMNLGSSGGIYNRMNLSLALYLVSNHLFNEPYSSNAKSLSEYKNAFRAMIDYSGAELMNCVKAITRQKTGDILVSEINAMAKRAIVLKSVYQQWLKEGGSAEMILGMVCSGRMIFSKNVILEQKESLIEAWRTYVSMAQSANRMNLKKNLGAYALSECMASVEEATQEEIAAFGSGATYKSKIHASISEEIAKLGTKIDDDIYETALLLVAKGRFFYTSAYSILNEMHEASKHSETPDPREAGLLSVISYFTDYLVGMIQEVK